MNEYDIIKIYEEMERELVRSMTRNLERHKKEEKKVGFEFSQWQAEKLRSLQKYRQENKHIIEAYTKGLNKDVAGMLSNEMKQGKLEAFKEYEEALKDGYKTEVEVPAKFFKTNSRKANTFIKVINNDLKKANNAALRRSNDIYREVIHKASTFVGNGVYTEKKAVDMAIKEFKEKGINCIVYKNGARHTISDYSAMAIRTANQRATLMAEGEFRKKIGETLVILSKHGTACEICQQFEGRVFIDDVYSGGTKEDGNYPLLSEAMAQGMFHPNCRHGLNTYYEGITEVELQKDARKTDNNIEKNNNINAIDTSEDKKTVELNSIYDRIEKKGVIVRTTELDLLDKQLMTENLNKFDELIDKYPIVKKYAEENMITINSKEDEDDVFMITTLRMNSSSFIKHTNTIYFNSIKYKNYAQRVNEDLDDMIKGIVMPASKSQIPVYNMAHEFGHLLENILMTTDIEEAGEEITVELLIKKSDEYAKEIEKIAKRKNPNFNLEDVLSLCGKEDSKELFAEAFANMECGNPNELGYAMKEFLKKKGL